MYMLGGRVSIHDTLELHPLLVRSPVLRYPRSRYKWSFAGLWLTYSGIPDVSVLGVTSGNDGCFVKILPQITTELHLQNTDASMIPAVRRLGLVQTGTVLLFKVFRFLGLGFLVHVLTCIIFQIAVSCQVSGSLRTLFLLSEMQHTEVPANLAHSRARYNMLSQQQARSV
jgi:hypothetical protein